MTTLVLSEINFFFRFFFIECKDGSLARQCDADFWDKLFHNLLERLYFVSKMIEIKNITRNWAATRSSSIDIYRTVERDSR